MTWWVSSLVQSRSLRHGSVPYLRMTFSNSKRVEVRKPTWMLSLDARTARIGHSLSFKASVTSATRQGAEGFWRYWHGPNFEVSLVILLGALASGVGTPKLTRVPGHLKLYIPYYKDLNHHELVSSGIYSSPAYCSTVSLSELVNYVHGWG